MSDLSNVRGCLEQHDLARVGSVPQGSPFWHGKLVHFASGWYRCIQGTLTIHAAKQLLQACGVLVCNRNHVAFSVWNSPSRNVPARLEADTYLQRLLAPCETFPDSTLVQIHPKLQTTRNRLNTTA
ncbi:unnamed protein product [Ectocarpus sp. 4 AP-2014]